MTTQQVSDLIFRTKDDAQKVLEALTQLGSRYNVVTVEDLNDLAGVPSTHADHKRGWAGFSGASITEVANGFIIDLPPAEEII